MEISFFNDENRREPCEALTCSFTGHRSILPEHDEELRDRLVRAVEYAYSNGVRTFFAGGAIGFDTLAAREIMRFRISHPDVRLSLILPCPEQADAWSHAQRDAYEYILGSADTVEYVSEEYTKTCMKKRNARLAEEGDIIIAYLYRMGSGSSQTVRIATELGKKVYNIAPRSRTLG